MNTDCIYFEETYEEMPQYRHCTYRRSLFKKGEEDEIMCRHCRLWDAYTPKDSTQEQINIAKNWQNLPYGVQPDYHEYFGI